MSISCYAAMAAKAPLQEWSYEPRACGDYDVEIKISHCGICHSDIHLIDNDWTISEYPLVPGHEIVGTVTKLGNNVTHLKKGQRVGVGWQRSACLRCRDCLNGNENLCAESTSTCLRNYGGFASAIVIDSRFAFAIPDAMKSENAAPLLCGGITVFAPIKKFNVSPLHRVGIMGIGGLGHLALQFARAWGCEVVAITSTMNKKEECKKFGAHDVVTLDQATEKMKGSFDFILSTVNADLNWKAAVDCLRSDGRLAFVGIPPSPMTLPIVQLLGQRKSVSASPIGGRRDMQDMLEFAARHNIAAQTQCVPIHEVNNAVQMVRENKPRYRMVLENR